MKVKRTKEERTARRKERQRVFSSIASGWLARAETLATERNELDDDYGELPQQEQEEVISDYLDKYLGVETDELQAWCYALAFALTLSPKARKRFKQLAHDRFLTTNITNHLTPGAPTKTWTPESKKTLARLFRRGFQVKRKPKEQHA